MRHSTHAIAYSLLFSHAPFLCSSTARAPGFVPRTREFGVGGRLAILAMTHSSAGALAGQGACWPSGQPVAGWRPAAPVRQSYQCGRTPSRLPASQRLLLVANVTTKPHSLTTARNHASQPHATISSMRH